MLKMQTYNSSPITSSLSNSTRTLLSHRENKNLPRSQGTNTWPVHTQLLKFISDIHINFLLVNPRTSGNWQSSSARQQEKDQI